MLRHAWLLFVLLFAVGLTTSAAVHAREALDSTATACAGEAHADGDSDQVPADADQDVPHHHGGCHGHAIALETGSPAPFLHLALTGGAIGPRPSALASRLIDPTLRPPRG